jgi:hypothetical protein
MAMVIATRIQDDLSSIVLTSFALARPAGRSRGLRTDSPLFRADLLPPLPHSQMRLVHPEVCLKRIAVMRA